MVTFCQTKYNPVKQADCVILDRKFWQPGKANCPLQFSTQQRAVG